MTNFSRPKAVKHLRTTSKERVRTRSYHLLPYHPRQLSPGDVAEVVDDLERRIALLRDTLGSSVIPWGPQAARHKCFAEWEACFGISVVLDTGWRLANLYDLKAFRDAPSVSRSKTREGFFHDEEGELCVQLTPRSAEAETKWVDEGVQRLPPTSTKPSRSEAEFSGEDCNDAVPPDPWSIRRYDPAPVRRNDKTRIELSLSRHSSALLALRPAAKATGSTIFRTAKEDLWSKVEAILRARRSPMDAVPRRATRTVEALERFRRQQLIQQENGDPVEAARATGRFENIAAGRYYGTTSFRGRDSSGNRVEVRVGAARPYDPSSLAHVLNTLRERCLADPQNFGDLAAYTAFVVVLATGHRGTSGPLPGSRSIDSETGFCVIHDKFRKKPERARIVWVAPVVRDLIRRYELAVVNLDGPRADNCFGVLHEQIEKGELHFPTGTPSNAPGKLEDYLESVISSCLPTGHVPTNVGRHWFRTIAPRRISSATIDAFLGHWNSGAEPWAHGSCLDPVVFRSELLNLLPDELSALGIQALGNPIEENESSSLAMDFTKLRSRQMSSTYCSVFSALRPAPLRVPTFAEIRAKLSHSGKPKGAGRMLASAIFNGAFLEVGLLDAWLDAAHSPTFEPSIQWVSLLRDQDHRFSRDTLRNYQHLMEMLLMFHVNRSAVLTSNRSSTRQNLASASPLPPQLANDNLPPKATSQESLAASSDNATKAVVNAFRSDKLGGKRKYARSNANDPDGKEFGGFKHSPPPWTIVLLCLNGENIPTETLHRHALTTWRAASWRKKAHNLYSEYFAIDDGELRFIAPQGAMAQFELNRLWAEYSRRTRPIPDDQKDALANFVRNYKGKRSQGKLPSHEAVKQFRELMEDSGLRGDCLQVHETRPSSVTVSIKVAKWDADELGWTNDVTRRMTRPLRRSSKQKAADEDQKRVKGVPYRSEIFPNHRPIVQAYKLFFLMMALCEGVHAKPLPHGNSKRVRV